MKKMKANAKKLLALIMAMVMVLSLAAPAMATSSEAVRKATLTAQAVDSVATVTDIRVKATGTDVILVNTNVNPKPENADEYDLSEGNLPKWIKSKTTHKAHVGDSKGEATYVVTVNTDDYVDATDLGTTPLTVVVRGEEGNTVKLTETAQWEELKGAAVYFGKNQVKGYSWQEEQDDGTYRVFFKLATVKDKAFQTGDSDWKYFVVENPYTTKRTESNMSAALESAVEWNTTKEEPKGTRITDAGVTLEAKTVNTTETVKVINATDVTVTATGTDLAYGGFAKGKETGTFQVSIEVNTDGNISYKSASDVETYVKKQLEGKCEVVSVAAATGNYYTVTVKKLPAGADAYKMSDGENWHKAVIYWEKNSETKVAGLYDIDEEKGGFYNGTDKDGANGSQIVKGTELLGPVAVKKSDVTGTGFVTFTPNNDTIKETNDGWYVFDSVDTMKKTVQFTDCKQSKTVSYVQLVMNKMNGSKENGLVKVTDYVAEATRFDDYVVKPADGWYLEDKIKEGNNKDFVKKGSFAVEAKKHLGEKTVTEVTKEPTCQTPGEETTKTICTVCGAVISSTTKELAKLSDPVEKNNAPHPADANKKKVVFDDADVKAGRNSTKHYVAKAEKVTTLSDDKMTTTVTTTYTCNFGFVHDELTEVETIAKTKLQHSGRWNHISLTKENEIDQLSSGSYILRVLKKLTIVDSDVDNINVPMNRTKDNTPAGEDADVTIDIPLTTLSEWQDHGWTYENGTYTKVTGAYDVGVYASSTGLPTTKYYAAVVTVGDVKEPAHKHADNSGYCDDGSCVVSAVVYEIKEDADGGYSGSAVTGLNLTNNLKKGKVEQVNTFSQSVVLPGTGHQFFNELGQATELCTRCGAKKPKETDATNDLSQATITIDPVKYAGTAMTEKDLNITVKLGKTTLARGIDFEVGELNIKAAGKYTVVVAGKGTYNGRQAIELTVTAPAPAAKKQTLKVSVAKKTFKVKNLKKKKASFTTKLSGAKTKVTWKSSNKKVTVKVSGKKATITVKKGTKKGTYKVTATAKKTSAYKKGTVTIKVIVK